MIGGEHQIRFMNGLACAGKKYGLVAVSSLLVILPGSLYRGGFKTRPYE